jgi:hypothetical protein
LLHQCRGFVRRDFEVGFHLPIIRWCAVIDRAYSMRNGIRCADSLIGQNGRKENPPWTNAHILPVIARLQKEKNTAVPIATTLKT